MKKRENDKFIYIYKYIYIYIFIYIDKNSFRGADTKNQLIDYLTI